MLFEIEVEIHANYRKHSYVKIGDLTQVTWVCLKTHGTTGQDGASLPQLATMSSPWWRDGADDGTAIIAIWWKRSYRGDGTNIMYFVTEDNFS